MSINELKYRNSATNNQPIYPEMMVGVGLQFLGGPLYKDIEDIFGSSNHSVRRIVTMFVNAVRAYKEIDIFLPSTPEELEETASTFAQCYSANDALNGCAGCIDGWLVCTNKPEEYVSVQPLTNSVGITRDLD